MTSPSRTLIRTLILPLIACAALAGTGASAATFTSSGADYGQPVAAATADQAVKIDAATRWVNVTDGQTVRFEVDGKAFNFSFDTWPGAQQVDLATIAPKDFAVPHVRVYIAPSLRYMG